MLTKPPAPPPAKFRALRMVRRAVSGAVTLQGVIRKIGTAIIGGSFTGGARGDSALDIQQSHGAATHVASGARSIALGRLNKASGSASVAIGDDNEATTTSAMAFGSGNLATGLTAVAFGQGSEASGDYSNALGQSCRATANYANALGVYAQNGVANTTNICGPIIVYKGGATASANWFLRLGGVEVVLFTNPLDLKTAATHTLALPAGCKFWCNEVGLIVTSVDGLTAQPTVTFDPGKASGATTLLTAAGNRERWTSDDLVAAHTSLVFTIGTGATATALLARAYWQGLLLQNE